MIFISKCYHLYFCRSEDFLSKHIFKYYMSKICSLDANSEIFLLRLFSQDLPTLPQIYNEMFSAWYILFIEKEDDLNSFCTPKVANKGKMLKQNDFMNVGVTHI